MSRILREMAILMWLKVHVWTAPWHKLSDVAAGTGPVRSRVRPVDAVDMTAGHNALRISGPVRSNALTRVGCPDRRSAVTPAKKRPGYKAMMLFFRYVP